MDFFLSIQQLNWIIFDICFEQINNKKNLKHKEWNQQTNSGKFVSTKKKSLLN